MVVGEGGDGKRLGGRVGRGNPSCIATIRMLFGDCSSADALISWTKVSLHGHVVGG